MMQTFAPLFTVKVNHDYYVSDCDDFEFNLSPATAANNLLYRQVAGCLYVLFDIEARDPLHDTLAGTTLVFSLKLTNPMFSNFTKPVLSDAKQVPFYSNVSNSSVLDSPQGVVTDAGVWGLVAIKIDTGFYITPPVFTLDFSARQENLKYFIVADNYTQNEFDQLEVADTGFNEESRSELKFDKVLPNSFSESDISPALLGAGSSRIVLFRSRSVVARRQRGLRRIQLNRNGDVLVAHLPQPTPERSRAQFVIHLSKL